VDNVLASAFDGLSADAQVLRNKSFDAQARAQSAYDPVLCSALTAEVSAEDEKSQAVEAFQNGVIRLVQLLRARGAHVTASCDFEDRVAQETGWNWSARTTEPPGRVRR
jgi:hypothetical protein